ncbi:MAG TPA: hypothetical protein VJK51_05250 [Candidatus Nanoarchaeia archaeon]|nr:hypothetical protein [Candidatus Nanoarchaeia archaeon]
MAESPLESITRREALGRIGTGLVLGLAGFLAPRSAEAFDWTIEELYARSEPAYHVMPGMRYKHDGEGDRVSGIGQKIEGADWKDYYFNDPHISPQLQNLFRNLHGQVVSGGGMYYTFSFDRFHKFMEENADKISDVVFYEKGFIGIAFKNRDLYTLPVPQETTKTIINM